MINNRTLVIALLVLITALATNVFLDREREPEERDLSNDPDMYMKGAVITEYDDGGARIHEIRAEQLTHFPLTDTTTMKSPFMSLFKTAPQWDILAKNGRLLPKSDYRREVIELWDDVTAEQARASGDIINITTSTLTVYPTREYAETKAHVRISDRSGETSAAGMQAFFGEGRYIFYSTSADRVHTVLLPDVLTSRH